MTPPKLHSRKSSERNSTQKTRREKRLRRNCENIQVKCLRLPQSSPDYRDFSSFFRKLNKSPSILSSFINTNIFHSASNSTDNHAGMTWYISKTDIWADLAYPHPRKSYTRFFLQSKFRYYDPKLLKSNISLALSFNSLLPKMMIEDGS